MTVGSNELFVAVLGVSCFALLMAGFRLLPRERWQVLATIPLYKAESGHWQAVNLTSYGFVTACAYVLSLALVFVLLGALGLPGLPLVYAAVILLALVMPASRLIAKWVEKKAYTFTIGGASFVGIVAAPWAIVLVNRAYGNDPIPVVAALAAFATAYAFGEGIGRLACISFGCCYGKPLRVCHPLLQRLFARWHFVFEGKTKKIAYEGRLDGERVLPIQGITAALYVGVALIAAEFFLDGHYTAALLIALGITQTWRALSEILRADYRGGGRVSAYQVLALLSTVYVVATAALVPSLPVVRADVLRGLHVLWDPLMIVGLLTLWVGAFVYSGRSMVTRASVAIEVCEDRI